MKPNPARKTPSRARKSIGASKLTSAQDAINQAVGADYTFQPKAEVKASPRFSNTEAILLDPKFWQALARARGWDEKICLDCGEPATACKCRLNYELEVGFGEPFQQPPTDEAWYVWALRFFTTRLAESDERAFWESTP